MFGDSSAVSGGVLDLSTLDGSNGFVINGIDGSDSSGISVSGAGDINGDGFDDVIIGGSLADPNGNSLAGESYVVFGGSIAVSGGVLDLSTLDGSNGFVINGIDSGDSSGTSVSGAGDVNGDGVSDLIIGAPFADPNGDGSGESYVVFGSTGVGSTGTIELSELDGSDGFVINGVDANDYAGGAGGSGDINGDGFDDVIIGAYGADPNGNGFAGESYVVFGQGDGSDAFELDDSFAAATPIVEGVSQNGHSIHEGGADIDFATFNLTCEADVVIETSGVSGDTVLELFDSGMNSVTSNDDIDFVDGNLFSRITTALSPGQYFIRVNEFSENDEIPEYTLSYDRTCLGMVGVCNGLLVTVDLNLGETPGPGDDVILGTPGNDDIRGRGGNDTICGMGGDDFLHGNSGDDWIDGGDGVDNLRGGQGDDVINTGSGATVGTASIAFGGTGDDEINGGVDADDLRGGSGVDTINGNGGNDVITGNADGDVINGGNGDDELRGGQGDDTLNGESGDDFLSGGGGTLDVCDGGAGSGDTATVSCETVIDVP